METLPVQSLLGREADCLSQLVGDGRLDVHDHGHEARESKREFFQRERLNGQRHLVTGMSLRIEIRQRLIDILNADS